MARSRIPNPLERRHLLERKIDPAHALRIAEAYMEEGRAVEAIPFFERAEAHDRLEGLRDLAVESGDAFMLRAVAHAMEQEPAPEDWARLAEAAEAAGKELYAAQARRQAEAVER